jgi:hypothetical protein
MFQVPQVVQAAVVTDFQMALILGALETPQRNLHLKEIMVVLVYLIM